MDEYRFLPPGNQEEDCLNHDSHDFMIDLIIFIHDDKDNCACFGGHPLIQLITVQTFSLAFGLWAAFHSLCRASAGLARAALTVWKLMVKMKIASAIPPPARNVKGFMPV